MQHTSESGPSSGRGHLSEGERALRAVVLGVLLGLALALLGRPH